ncbi:MAG: DUF2294 domain-containing protein [Cyanobacteria bacterium CRU_2_1]|nr:DUF2294 domain-containing protein [Cyanobacteria bacterium RU_5_0]NJR61076.1 DUF2294 domain-containing protein [Cyanobacteria bacterium CRU_2_1]
MDTNEVELSRSQIPAFPTREQLESTLSRHVQSLYASLLGQQPDDTTCQLLDTRLAFFLENAITQPERLLFESDRKELAQQVRSSLDEILQPRLQALIEAMVNVSVCDLLTSAQLETRRISIIAILAERPKTNNSPNQQID